MVIALPGTEFETHVGFKTGKYAKLLPLKNERIDEWSFNIEATSTEYDTDTGIMTFMFPRPMYEMELPEPFIEKAKGIVMKKSNLELVYED